MNSPYYTFFVIVGAVAAMLIKRAEAKRLGYQKDPRYAGVGAGCLIGAIIGSKVAMVFYLDAASFHEMFSRLLEFNTAGKTVLGGLTGGYIGGEIAKKLLGVTYSTGDALAVALPVAQGLGRLGCFLSECCYGVAWNGPLSVFQEHTHRVPVQLLESTLCFGLAIFLWNRRSLDERKPGVLFRYYVIGYAAIRLSMEFLRGEPQANWAGITASQWYCLAIVLLFSYLVFGRNDSKGSSVTTS